MATNKWPYTDFHELNLDWILGKVKNIDSDAAAASEAAEHAADSAAAANIDAQTASGAADRAEAARDAAAASAASIASGSPKVVLLASEMTDTDIIYLYMGSEQGMTYGDWYYYDGYAWLPGGPYGSVEGVTQEDKNLILTLFENAAFADDEMYDVLEALRENWRVPGTYTIINNLTNVTNSNSATLITENSPYDAVLAGFGDYQISTVQIKMGGIDITSSAYSDGTIAIPQVTGDIIITASAGWIDNVMIIPNTYFHRGKIGASYPYWTSNNTRVSYVDLGVDISTAYTYKITYETTYSGSTNIGVQYLTSSGLTKARNHSAISASAGDAADMGWQSSGYVFTPTSTSVRFWFTFRAGSGSTSITVANFPSITIERTEI